jgi:hypothetical protein
MGQIALDLAWDVPYFHLEKFSEKGREGPPGEMVEVPVSNAPRGLDLINVLKCRRKIGNDPVDHVYVYDSVSSFG